MPRGRFVSNWVEVDVLPPQPVYRSRLRRRARIRPGMHMNELVRLLGQPERDWAASPAEPSGSQQPSRTLFFTLAPDDAEPDALPGVPCLEVRLDAEQRVEGVHQAASWPAREWPPLPTSAAQALGVGLPRCLPDEAESPRPRLPNGRELSSSAESPDGRFVALAFDWDDPLSDLEVWRRGPGLDPLEGGHCIARARVRGHDAETAVETGLAFLDDTWLISADRDSGVLWRWDGQRLTQAALLDHPGGSVTTVLCRGDLILLDDGCRTSVWQLDREAWSAEPLTVFTHFGPLQLHPKGDHVLAWCQAWQDEPARWEAWPLPR